MAVTRRAALKTLFAGAIGAGAGLGAYGYAYERVSLSLTRADLPVSGLSPAHEGLRIGFLTDLHHGPFLSQAGVARAAAFLMDQRPDLIVLGGDYVTDFDRRYMGPCAEALGALSAAHGVFAVLGNHDDDRYMPAALEAQRFAVLRDARTTVTIKGAPLDLAGVRFWTRQPADIAAVLKGSTATQLLIAHDPRRLVQAAQLAVPAVLAGHTHGGQLLFPGLGSPASRRFPVLAGRGSLEGTNIFVSRGVGTVIVPLRLNCPPEVALVVLRRPTARE